MSPVVKKKGEKFTLPSKYLLFILTLLCMVLIVLTFNTNFLSAPLSAAGGFLVTPLQEGISKAGSWLNTRSEELVQIRSLLSENEQLRAQVDELTMENIKLQQDRYELTNLRELYDLDAQYDDYDKVGARIIAKDSGNWFHSFVINKGYQDGLAIDMNVMAGSGLVGRIVDVGPDWSKVMSIIDDNSNTSGMVLSTSDNLIVCGDLELYADGVIRFEKLIDSADRVVEGDKIVTSNVSDKYLPGILIGYISSINVDSNNLTKSGLITPAVDFEHLEEVLVITELKKYPTVSPKIKGFQKGESLVIQNKTIINFYLSYYYLLSFADHCVSVPELRRDRPESADDPDVVLWIYEGKAHRTSVWLFLRTSCGYFLRMCWD